MAKKITPVWFDNEFPNWKKNVIGGFRAFVTGFIGVLATQLITADIGKITTGEFWLNAILIGGVSGGLIYLGKWLRDKFFESPIAQKMPI